MAGKLSQILLFLILAAISILFPGNKVINAEKNETNESAASVVVNASVDRNETTIGDKIRLTIAIEHDPDVEVSFPEFGEKLADFTIKDYGITGPKKSKTGRIEQKEWYLLDTFLTGSYVIPPLTIRYKTTDGGSNDIETKEIFVEVKSVINEEEAVTDIREIIGPVNIPINYSIIYLIIGGAFGLLAAIGGSIYFFKRKNGVKKDAAPPPAAHEIAYKELKDMIELDLISKGMVKEYYYRLSNIARRYIENRFALMAPERTTEEFLSEMADAESMEKEHKGLIKIFLRQCDLVKFAKYGPNSEEIDGAYNAAKKLIDETKLVGS